MAEAYYEPIPATDGMFAPVPGAVFQVFEIADTTFSTPLSLRVGSGNPTTTVTASDTLATLPGVYVTSPNFEHIWVSGSFQWRRDSIDGAKGAIERAESSALSAANAAADAERESATSAQAAKDAAALVDAPADTVLADLAANPNSAFAGQLSATITEQTGPEIEAAAETVYATPRASGFAVLGDSITSFNQNGGDVWHKVLSAISKGRLRHMGFFATGGHTLAQIETDHLPQVLALPVRPGACIIAGGTNDTGNPAYNQTESRATLLRIINTLQANSIMPVLWTLPPRDDSTTANALVQRWNVWVRYLAQSKALPLVDSHRALTDPATGLFQANLKQDAVHPNRAGHFQIGKHAGTDPAFLTRFPDSTPHLSDSKLDAANLIPSGYAMFDSGVNGAGIPTGWSGYGQGTGYTPSIVTDTAVPGNWFRMTKGTADTATSGGLQYNLTTGFAAGDRLALAARFALSTTEAGTETIGSLSVQARTGGVTTVQSSAYGSGGTFEGITYTELVVPVGVDTIRMDMNVSGATTSTAYLQVAQPTIINLTALGIV